MDIEHIRGWIGRNEQKETKAIRAPVEALAALLDYETPPWPADRLPELAHWLLFWPTTRQSEMDIDGHPKRTGFLPPITLERRMWAGSRVRFHAPIKFEDSVRRTSTINDIILKQGTSGLMIFLQLHHAITANGTLAVTEEQDLVYRAASPAQARSMPAPDAPRGPEYERHIVVDPVMLFRFSALTFNAHRIHYDREYAVGVEGYGGLVVQGPLIAVLLADHLRRYCHKPLTHFSFRAHRPLLDAEPFRLCLAQTQSGYDLWAQNATGQITLTATAMVAA